MEVKQLNITFLGTAGAIPTSNRSHTSLWVECDKTAILIDCSGDVIQKIKKYHLSEDLLDHVIITHGHIDHTYALPALLEALRLQGRTKPLHIYICESAFKKQYQILELCNLLHREDGFSIIFHTVPLIENYHLISDIDMDCFTYPVKHLIPNVAIRFTEGFKSLTYSSDTEPFDEFADFAMNSDVLIHECLVAKWFSETLTGHSRTDQVGKIAQKAKAKTLYPVHFSPKVDENLQRFQEEIAQEYSGKIVVPYDGLQFRLKDDKIEEI